ncbi:phospholipase-like protein, partial [Tanacetum coccineum]
EPDVSCLQAKILDEARFDDAVKDNDEMKHTMDVDNEAGKYCLDDMSIGKKVNLDQCILDLMDMSEENVYNTPSLKTCFSVVERKRKHEEENLESTEYDYETIPPFTENIKSGEPSKLFKLAWDPYGIVVDDQFWLAFMGFKEKRVVHRQYWALVGPYFCPAIIGGGMPIYISKAKGCYVPWTDVDKVYFPLNEPELHWALAELHLCIGVIIIYDSIAPKSCTYAQN